MVVTILLDLWFFKLMFEEYLINLVQEGSTSSNCFNCVTCKKYKLGRDPARWKKAKKWRSQYWPTVEAYDSETLDSESNDDEEKQTEYKETIA